MRADEWADLKVELTAYVLEVKTAVLSALLMALIAVEMWVAEKEYYLVALKATGLEKLLASQLERVAVVVKVCWKVDLMEIRKDDETVDEMVYRREKY